MTTQARLLLSSIALTLIACATVGSFSYYRELSKLREGAKIQLTQARLSQTEILKAEFTNLGKFILIVSEMQRIRETLKKVDHSQLRKANWTLLTEDSRFARGSDKQFRFFQNKDLIHPFLIDYAERFDLADLLLIDSKGNLIYSVKNGLAAGQTIEPTLKSQLANISLWASNAQPRSYKFYDFAPSSDHSKKSVGYFASPIYDNSYFLGAIVFQIPTERIDRILNGNYQWTKLGLRNTGEVIAIGQDGFLRNNARTFLEKTDRPFKQAEKNYQQAYSTHFQWPLEQVHEHFRNDESIESEKDYLQKDILASIGKFHLPGGGEWLVIAKIDQNEISAPLKLKATLIFWGFLFLFITQVFILIYFFRKISIPTRMAERALESILKNQYPEKFELQKDDPHFKLKADCNELAVRLREASRVENLLNEITESLNDLFFLIHIEETKQIDSSHWTIVKINLAVSDRIGISADSLINSDLKLWLDADFKKIHSQLLKSTKGHAPIRGSLKQLSGSTLPVALSFNKINPLRATGMSFILTASDISTQQALENKVKENETLLNDSQAMSKTGSFRWEISSGISSWSEQLFYMLGLNSDKSRPSLDIFRSLVLTEDLHILDVAYRDALKKLIPFKADLRVRTADTHELIWIRMTGQLHYDQYGHPKFMTGVVQDVTDLKNTEMALIATKNEALKSSQAKSEFLAHMSHEIRTPMNAIMGMAELLRETPLNKDQEFYVTIFCKAGEVLMALINDILDISKIEAGEVSIENIPFDLTRIMSEVESMMRPRALEKGLDYSYEIAPGLNPHLMGDPTKLRQVLMNLASNAIKFTSSGSVRIKVIKNPSKKESAIISVTDTGVGIPESKQHLIFQKFSQADSSVTRRYGGTGLGLAISKSLIELMGGQIWFKSREGTGTSFFVSTPLREQTTNPSQTPLVPLNSVDLKFAGPKQPRDPLKKVRILLADDTEDNRILFRHYLKNGPYEIIEADNGLEAVNKVKSEMFDIIFMDVQMPEMDGYAATEQIRQWEVNMKHPHIPIIALTAYALSDDKDKSLRAGCDDHITKPFKRNSLIGAMDRYLH